MKFLSNFSRCLVLTAIAGSLVAAEVAAQTPPPQNPPHPARVRAKMDGFDLSSQSGKAPNQIGGASRDLEPTPSLYAPQAAKAYSTHPTFYWSTADDTQKVLFRLMSDKGVTIFESTITGSHFTYPSDAPNLSPGNTYRWTIKPENDMLGSSPAPVDVVIVGGNQRATIESALGNAHDADAMAKVFVDNRVWYDALSTYTEAIKAHPEDKNLLRERAALYDQLPATQSLADRDLAATN